MNRTLTISIATWSLMLLAPGLTLAQPAPWRTVGTVPQLPEWTNLQLAPGGARERAYAEGFSNGEEKLEVRRIRFVWAPGAEGLASRLDGPVTTPVTDSMDSGARRVVGVEARIGEDLEVSRLRFRSPEAALAFASGSEFVFDRGKRTRVVEVRGDQVLILTGARLDDPVHAAGARRVGWRRYPVSGESALLLVTRGKDNFSASTAPRGPLHEKIREAVQGADASREKLANPESSVRGEWSGDTVRIWNQDFTATLRSSAEGSSATLAVGEGHAERADQLAEHLAAVEEASRRFGAGPDAQHEQHAGPDAQHEQHAGVIDQLGQAFGSR